METCKTLKVGDIIRVRLEEDSRWLDEWIIVEAKRITICHSDPGPQKLNPYICVGVDHPKLRCFNYSMYCLYDAVELLKYKKLNGTNVKIISTGNRKEAWHVKNVTCSLCAGTVMACDSFDKSSDYEWFCLNESCENNQGERSFDDERPTWVETK
jgi:hypothetical protein